MIVRLYNYDGEKPFEGEFEDAQVFLTVPIRGINEMIEPQVRVEVDPFKGRITVTLEDGHSPSDFERVTIFADLDQFKPIEVK